MLCDQLIEKVGGTNTAIGNIINTLKAVFNGVITFIEGVFSGNWKKAWEGITEIFKGIVNGIITLFEGMINFIIDGLNWLIDKLNFIQIKMPDWVEEKFGVGSIGFNIPEIKEIQLPRLATGAVIPPNREFMAVLGDQKSGTNIETPEALLRKIVREEGGATATNITISFEGNLAQLGRVLEPVIRQETKRRGSSFA